ncbi:M56 family metallopeptidase [Roseivirga sp. E12]|uniref:M56 family metallopeptidase n=1 Tax=Roseivirga sp. E12 TaxID=2819237 RepID=UPI001ABCB4EF|nr:M56 family metallopeptidase [Roseivirga sp. E12]MBO3698808.1 M48 family metalloprotease [Roseivirga sp. E12]
MVINRQLFDALGMTLIDSLWQGAIVMSIAFFGLLLMKKSRARLRHNFLLVCILALPILGVYTFNQRFERAKPIVEISGAELTISSSVESANFYNEPLSTPAEVQNQVFEFVEMTPWIGVIWTIGLAFVLLRSLGSYAYLNRLKSEASEIQENEITRLLEKLKNEFDLKRTIFLKESSKVSSPMVYGFFKPIILFPLGLIQGLTMDEVEVIFLHELAHLKRNDFLINIVINGLRAVYFYHPVYWWLQSQLDNEREFASDEMVMDRHADGLTLVRALTKAQEFSMLSPSIGFAGSSKNQLLKRVNRIMKKQQKPNWTGLILPCVILLSVFLFTSQSQKKAIVEPELTESNLERDLSDTLPNILTFDLDKPGIIGTSDDSILRFDISDKQEKSDTITVAQATMEILEDSSLIVVTTDSNGKPTRITRDDKRLRGKTFEVYSEAYMRLNNYSSKVAEKKMSEFMGSNPQTTKKNKPSNINLGNENFKELTRLVDLWAHEKELGDKMVVRLSNDTNPSNEETEAARSQIDKIGKLEENIGLIIEKLTPKQKEAFYRHYEVLERQKQLKDQTQMVELDKVQAQRTRLLQNMLLVEQQKLDQMILEASTDPESVDPKVLNDQVVKLKQLEKELLAFHDGGSNAEKYINHKKMLEETTDRQQAKLDAILQKQQEILALSDELAAKQQEADLFRSTVYSDDHQLYEFPKGKVEEEIWELVSKPIQNLGNKPVLEVDGKLRPDLKFSDFRQEDISSIQIFKDRAQQKRYPNGETKGYDGIISIITNQGDGKLKEELGTERAGVFSSKNSRYNFSESKAGQEAAGQVIRSSMMVFEKPVLVLDGKFMPDNYLLEYKDSFIKSINIYKDKSLKKFPKRKIKDYKTVVEVITK